MNSEPSLEDTEGSGSVIEQVIRKQEKGVNYQEPARENIVYTSSTAFFRSKIMKHLKGS